MSLYGLYIRLAGVVDEPEPFEVPLVEPVVLPEVELLVVPVVVPLVEPVVLPEVEPLVVPAVVPLVEPVVLPEVEPLVVPVVVPLVPLEPQLPSAVHGWPLPLTPLLDEGLSPWVHQFAW